MLSSRDNPRVKRWAKLAVDGRFRRKEKRALIEGPHLVAAFRQAGYTPAVVIVTEQSLAGKEIAALAGDAPTVVSERVFRSIVDADNPPGIAAEIELPEREVAADADRVFLEGVQDPGNVGAILRNAAAFGIGEVILDQACADPWSPRALRAGMGGHFSLAVRQVQRLDLAGFDGTLLCTVVRDGARLDETCLDDKLGWIFGGEGRGVSPAAEKQAKARITIPLCAGMESINVAAASAICLYAGFSRPRNPRRC